MLWPSVCCFVVVCPFSWGFACGRQVLYHPPKVPALQSSPPSPHPVQCWLAVSLLILFMWPPSSAAPWVLVEMFTCLANQEIDRCVVLRS